MKNWYTYFYNWIIMRLLHKHEIKDGIFITKEIYSIFYCMNIILFLSGLILILLLLYNNVEINVGNINNVISYIISSSSIFAGILVSYLIFKITIEKNERTARLPEIKQLFDKVSSLRKFLHIIFANKSSFFKEKSKIMIKDFDINYPNFKYQDLHESSIMADYNYNPVLQAYIVIKQIVDYDAISNKTWFYSHNNDMEKSYTLEDIYDFGYASSYLYTWFDYNYSEIENHLNFSFKDSDIKDMKGWVLRIDKKFTSKNIDNQLIANLGTDFDNIYFPQLIKLLEKNNQKMSVIFDWLLKYLFLIILFGTIFPIFIGLFKFSDAIQSCFIIFSLLTVFVCVLGILFTVYLMKYEISYNNS